MKRLILAALMTMPLSGADYELLVDAVSKLIDDNARLRQEIALLKMQTEKLARQSGDTAAIRSLQGKVRGIEEALRGLQPGVAAQSPHLARAPFEPYGARIAADTLNVRQGPGLRHPVRFRLPRGAEVTVVQQSGDHWYEIRDINRTGWAYGQWITPRGGQK